MPPKSTPMTQAAIRRMIKESVDAAIATEGRDTAPAVRECTFARLMKCNPAVFHGVEGAIELQRWFEKTKSVFEISECGEGKKVKFVVATLEGPALTWWKTKVATMGLETMNQMPWTEMKQLMNAEFCPIEEVQIMEHGLWNLKVKEYDVLMEQKSQARDARILEGKKRNQKQGNVRAMVTTPTDGKLPLCERCFTRHVGQCTIKCHKCRKVKHKERYCKKIKQEEGREVHGQAYAIKDAEPQGPNVVTGLKRQKRNSSKDGSCGL
ncbi:hypothetical protein Tco_0896996 [Tanacetum coccineum]